MNKLANKYKLSIILPSISPDKWAGVYREIETAIGEHTFELIIIGPNYPNEEIRQKWNVKFIRDFGCPSRCFQIGAMLAVGEYLTPLAEDMRAEPGILGQCLTFISQKSKKEIVSLTYSEGPGFTGTQHLDQNYWKPYTHDALRFASIDPSWIMCINPIIRTDYYREMGGIDCGYETVNMNMHDLMFRIQKAGGKIYLTSYKAYSIDWSPNVYAGNHGAIMWAWEQTDMPKFKEKYSQINPNMDPIEYNTWIKTDNIWARRKDNYLI